MSIQSLAKNILQISVLYAASTLFSSFVAFGKEEVEKPLISTATTKNNTQAFQEQYIKLGVGKNYPQGKSGEKFKPGYSHSILGYQHNLNDKWLLGIDAQFKVIKEKQNSDVVALWSISQQFIHMTRLYHPLYLTAGWKVIYIFPTNKASLPLQKASKYGIDIGVAGSLGLSLILIDKWILSLYADHWRGVRSTLFQASEAGLALSYAL